MNSIERLRRLKPWENVNEEDLYRVDGLWLSVRGQIHRPDGIWATPHQSNARRWVFEPDDAPAPDDWVVDLDRDEVRALIDDQERRRFDSAIAKVCDHFEGNPVEGLEFPVNFNL